MSRIDWTGPVWQTYSYQYEFATAPDGSDNNGQVRRAVMSYPQQVGQGWQTVTEQITYQYDTLRRLTSAASTKPWSEAYTYDGFGNRTGAGVPVNAATNRVSTYTHDNNGNVTGMPQMTLEDNVENRLDCAYDRAGQRVMKNGVITLYGIDGKRLGMYTVGIMGPNS